MNTTFINFEAYTIGTSKKLNLSYKQSTPWSHDFNFTATKLLTSYLYLKKKTISLKV